MSKLTFTPDGVTGEPCQTYLGFENSGKFDPDNKKFIYIKDCVEKVIVPKAVAELHVHKANAEDATYIAKLYDKNIVALHGAVISIDEWREALSENDEDEAYFLIYKGTNPVAWLKINGLSDLDSAWVSMLAVAPEFQRQGIGIYAVRYAEEYCKSYDKKKLFIKTTADNTAAQKLYQKCGYTICDKIIYVTSDGISRNGIVFEKTIT